MSSWHSASFPKTGFHVFPISRMPLPSTEIPEQETLDIVLNSLPYPDSYHVWVWLHAKLILQPHVLLPPPPLTCTCFSGLPASHLPASDLTFFFFLIWLSYTVQLHRQLWVPSVYWAVFQSAGKMRKASKKENPVTSGKNPPSLCCVKLKFSQSVKKALGPNDLLKVLSVKMF